MKIWLISQTENDGYDTFDSAVVIAETESEARQIHPSYLSLNPWGSGMWASSPDRVMVELLGEALDNSKTGVICSSFNAG